MWKSTPPPGFARSGRELGERMAPRKSSRVTIRDVALDAGVSTAAVSKVLRNAYGVSEALRGRVQESMQKLGYRPHAAARGMRGQTYTLGVLLPGANPSSRY